MRAGSAGSDAGGRRPPRVGASLGAARVCHLAVERLRGLGAPVTGADGTIGVTVSKTLTAYTCSACGHQSPKWMGRCTECGEWNSLVEEVVRAAPGRRKAASRAQVRPLSEVTSERSARIPTGLDELDRVLGGGLVPGSLVLVGGEPG